MQVRTTLSPFPGTSTLHCLSTVAANLYLDITTVVPGGVRCGISGIDLALGDAESLPIAVLSSWDVLKMLVKNLYLRIRGLSIFYKYIGFQQDRSLSLEDCVARW